MSDIKMNRLENPILPLELGKSRLIYSKHTFLHYIDLEYLVTMDYFSKWPEVFAIPIQEASTVADIFVENVFSRFGVPLEFHSDQGRNFESRLFERLCDLLGIRKTRTTPLHPQSDGIVERFNKTMKQHLSKVVDQHQKDWDQHIPLFLMAYRAAVHNTTGQSPSKVLFGRELPLPCDVVFGSPTGQSTNIETSWKKDY